MQLKVTSVTKGPLHPNGTCDITAAAVGDGITVLLGFNSHSGNDIREGDELAVSVLRAEPHVEPEPQPEPQPEPEVVSPDVGAENAESGVEQ